jgi:hypothetical protein
VRHAQPLARAATRAAVALLFPGGLAACTRTPARDARTHCPVAPPAATTLLLAPPPHAPASTRLALQALAHDEAARLGPGDRLVVAVLVGVDPARPASVLLARCAMTDPEADAVTAALGARDNDATAPFVAAIDQLARAPETRSASRLRLVLAGDMMERRAAEFSLYAAGADYASFRRTQAGLRPAADLANVSVRVVQLLDADRSARQLEARDMFWKPYFADSGARDVTFEP